MSQAKNQGEAQKHESKHFNLKAEACESMYFILLMLRDRLTRCLISWTAYKELITKSVMKVVLN